MPRARTIGRAALFALTALAAVALVVVIAYSVDTRGEAEVARGVTLAGEDVGGLRRPQLETRVTALADRVRTTEIRIRAPGGGIDTTAPAIELELHEPQTVDETIAIGHDGSVFKRIWQWTGSFFGNRRAPVQLRASEVSVYEIVLDKDPGPKKAAVEPSIKFEDGEFVVVDGESGEGIDPRAVLDALPGAAASGIPLLVEVERGEVPPRFSKEDAEAVAARAEEVVTEPMAVSAGGTRATVPLEALRAWVTAEPSADGLVLGLDDATAMESLRATLPDVGKAPVESRFTVSDGQVRIIAGENGTECCAPEALDRIEEVLRGGEITAVTLPLQVKEPALSVERARALEIKEPIGSFTTEHPSGQPRVNNIHRIADLLRGTVIHPGATFSVNRTVGRRTKDKGFVAAPVIEDGRFSEDVGGGISQFATTLFNAAFFAGLDFGEYQSHSIYISRYPYGREATLSFPHPDLEIKNTTPHGVLLWPTYTDGTITVTLYSTKFAPGEQTGQSSGKRGVCTRVTTERTRRYVDGTTKVDKVFATYRPGEGINC